MTTNPTIYVFYLLFLQKRVEEGLGMMTSLLLSRSVPLISNTNTVHGFNVYRYTYVGK